MYQRPYIIAPISFEMTVYQLSSLNDHRKQAGERNKRLIKDENGIEYTFSNESLEARLVHVEVRVELDRHHVLRVQHGERAVREAHLFDQSEVVRIVQSVPVVDRQRVRYAIVRFFYVQDEQLHDQVRSRRRGEHPGAMEVGRVPARPAGGRQIEVYDARDVYHLGAIRDGRCIQNRCLVFLMFSNV